MLVDEDAVIGFPALRMGGVPPVSAWLYNLGPQWTKRLLLTGDTFTGRMAKKIGFALEAVRTEELEDRVDFIARRIAAMGRDIAAISAPLIEAWN
jgi:enoyl-CoA hydratase